MKLATSAAAVALTLLAGTASAQTRLVEVSDNAVVQPFGIAADLLDDIDVYSTDGREVGDVEDIVGSDANTATHFQVDFDDDGGFPDSDDVLVPVEAMTLDGNRLVTTLTPAEVAALPRLDD